MNTSISLRRVLTALTLGCLVLVAGTAASADPRATSVPHTEEAAERPGSDRFDALTAVVTERSCIDGSPTILNNIVVDCVRPTATATTSDRHGHHRSRRHAARPRRHHRSHRHAQPVVDQAALAETLVTQRAPVGEHTPQWMRLGEIRASLQGMNGNDPRVDGLLIEARSILVGLGYNPPPVTPTIVTTPSRAIADATPTFPSR